MKQLISFCLLVLLFCSCDQAGSETPLPTPAAVSAGSDLPPFSKKDYKAGQQMMTSQDCLACHKPRKVPNAPSLAMLAAKYEHLDAATLEILANKVISGYRGKQNFAGMGEGEALMPPHSSLSSAESQLLVRTLFEMGKN